MPKLQAQVKNITLISKDGEGIIVKEHVQLKKNELLDNVLSAITTKLIDQNYLEASVDSVYLDTLTQSYVATLHKGPEYFFESISLDSLDGNLVEQIGQKRIEDKNQFIRFKNKCIEILANNGYPFSSIRLKETNYISDSINGFLQIDKGPLIIIDSILNKGRVNLSEKFIHKYLSIPQKSIYKQSRVVEISKKINDLRYIQQFQDPDITFYGNYATVNLYMKERNSSRFDFLFGIIPTQNIAGKQLFLSLDLTAEMINKLGNGEYFYVDFERLRPEQQKFQIKFNYPYLLGLNYALDIDFSIFRLGLEYQTLNSDIGIEYLFNNRDRLKLSWNYESSNLIDIDTTAILNQKMLPQDLDVSQNGLSLGLNISRLDYIPNPRSGFAIYLKTTAGLKTIQRNSSVLQLKNNEVDFSMAYDSLELKTIRLEIIAKLEKFIPIGQRSSIATQLQLGWRSSKNGLYRNEKFQIGGNKLMRGFDEAQFFTPYYSVASIEYRLLLSNNSFLSIPFVDVGFLETTAQNSTWAIGVGSGLGIETKAGVFQFSIAVGRTKDLSFDLRRPKAHFGFLSIF